MHAAIPAGAVGAMWRRNAAQNTFEGFSSAAPQASDLVSVNFLDAIWLCAAGAPSATATPAAGASHRDAGAAHSDCYAAVRPNSHTGRAKPDAAVRPNSHAGRAKPDTTKTNSYTGRAKSDTTRTNTTTLSTHVCNTMWCPAVDRHLRVRRFSQGLRRAD